MPIGELIRERRIRKGLTVEELAHRINVKKEVISRWETGIVKHIPTTHRVAIASALGFSEPIVADYTDVLEAYKIADDTIKKAIRILLKLEN